VLMIPKLQDIQFAIKLRRLERRQGTNPK
jgi:hypothetical protein